jgi:DNA repair protein RecO (recombination protein O)
MMRERVYRLPAVIIRRSDFAEADRLLTLITPQGKRRVVAKGARKTTSRLAGHIELFSHTILLLAVGRNLDIITQSAIVDSFDQLRTDLTRISAAYYVAELVDRFIEDEDENRLVFDLLVQTLTALDTTPQIGLVLRSYELHLLGLVGYRPQLHQCVSCHEQLTEEADRFSSSTGGMLCPRCANTDRQAHQISLATFKLLRYLQIQPIHATASINVSPSTSTEAETVLRAYIRQILERELKSVAFLEEVRSVS